MATIRSFFFTFFLSITCFNGLCPYLGIKWEYSMAMFSNMEYDCSNHLFMSPLNRFRREKFYTVESLDIGHHAPPSARLFATILRRIHHLGEPFAPGSSELPRALSRDMVCYHLDRMSREYADFRISLRDDWTNELIHLESQTLTPDWTTYDYFLRYPQIKGDFITLAQIAAERNRPDDAQPSSE